MERIWNYVHYFIYQFERNASKIITYPITLIFDLIYKIPFIINVLKKKNSSPQEIRVASENALNNRVYGQNIIISGIQMGGLIILLEYGLFNIFQAIIGKSLIQIFWEPGSPYKWIFIIGLLVMPWIINEKLLFKNDKYLKYFDEFDKEPKKIRHKWAWISFGIVVGILSFFILSFVLITNVSMD
ncbi:hypothetical protein C1631_021410 [Chryseobacterium phosphatilyticum]|uniref:Uncharacterized protein n=2 Tax=Chryseobacterium TaxID=59732 RepID=A0A316WT86_9FLAO|nr:hypothetical protein [Chryseobacterium phosphatilyticum]PWN63543.1 hypothetical protein C1631_021410 [Chryseobacterium phosphatilyticum]